MRSGAAEAKNSSEGQVMLMKVTSWKGLGTYAFPVGWLEDALAEGLVAGDPTWLLRGDGDGDGVVSVAAWESDLRLL